MAHALKLAHIIKAKVKTDRRDSLALAELHRVGYIPEGHIFPQKWRALRDLTRRRLSLVSRRGGDFRDLKMILTRHGLENPSRNDIQHLKLENLEKYTGLNEHLDQMVYDTYDFNQTLTKSIKSIEDKLENELKEDLLVQKIMDIPGIGITLSKTIRLEVESLDRFKNVKHFCSWCRVIPGIAQSGESQSRGRGSKQGNAYMKNALTQAAAAAIRRYPQINAYYTYHTSKRTSKGGKMISMNLIAHKLAKAVWMVFQGHDFEMDKLFSIEGLMGTSPRHN